MKHISVTFPCLDTGLQLGSLRRRRGPVESLSWTAGWIKVTWRWQHVLSRWPTLWLYSICSTFEPLQYLLLSALCPRKTHLVASLWSKHYLKNVLRRLTVNLAQAGFKDELIRVWWSKRDSNISHQNVLSGIIYLNHTQTTPVVFFEFFCFLMF